MNNPRLIELVGERVARRSWERIAHPGQIPPKDRAWFCYLMRSGRGGGKTRAGSEWVLQRVRDGYRHIALIGQTAADVRDTMVELGPSSIMKIARPKDRPEYEPSKRRLTFPNGAVATTFTGEEPDQLRGPAHDTVWMDELAKFKYPQETWDNMEMGLRLGENPQVFCTTTPRPIPIIKRLVGDPTTIDVRFSTMQNAENLSPLFLKRVMEKYGGTRLGRQELEGEILDDNPLALWQRDIIENLRVHTPPPLIRVGVGVDPAVTSGETSPDTRHPMSPSAESWVGIWILLEGSRSWSRPGRSLGLLNLFLHIYINSIILILFIVSILFWWYYYLGNIDLLPLPLDESIYSVTAPASPVILGIYLVQHHRHILIREDRECSILPEQGD